MEFCQVKPIVKTYQIYLTHNRLFNIIRLGYAKIAWI